MRQVKFMIQGSAEEPYEVRFTFEPGMVRASCTCPAGESGTHCKHRMRILEDDAETLDFVVDPDPRDLAEIRACLPGSHLEAAMQRVAEAEKQAAAAKAFLTVAKHALGVTLVSGR